MPARNSLEIETLAATPKITKPMRRRDHRARSCRRRRSGRPSAPCRGRRATIIGSSSAVSAAASATAEPDSAASRHGGDDGHVAQAAADVADQRQREVDDALRQAADVHDLAGQHEERHRQQREAVGAVDQRSAPGSARRTCPGATSARRRRRSSANAIGMPSAMAPSSEPRKTTIGHARLACSSSRSMHLQRTARRSTITSRSAAAVSSVESSSDAAAAETREHHADAVEPAPSTRRSTGA